MQYYDTDWKKKMDDTVKEIEKRKDFTYDLNGDAFYQQYKDKYKNLGKLASADVMGQAAAMTGGYGNSYAATAGNQAYLSQLNNLNDIVPELYRAAYDRHNQGTQDLYNLYSLYGDLDQKTSVGNYEDGYAAGVSELETGKEDMYNSGYILDPDGNWIPSPELQMRWAELAATEGGLTSAGYTKDENGKWVVPDAATLNANAGGGLRDLSYKEVMTMREDISKAADEGEDQLIELLEWLVDDKYMSPEDAAKQHDKYFPQG